MADGSQKHLIKISETVLVIQHPDIDLRGRHVVTSDGEKLGSVDDLLIDEKRRRVRFIEVATGGFLGIHQDKSLIPVEAIASTDQGRVVINHSLEHVAAAPMYNPQVVQPASYHGDVYEHYGYPPPWTPGAITPLD